MEKTKESPNKYICSNPNVLPSCENRQANRCHYKGLCYLKEDRPKLTNDFVTIAEKSNIEKQADLVEETAFENLKVKKPITYTEEEVLEYLNSLNDLLEEKQYISNINEGVISTSNMSSREINELNKREEYIQSITNNNFKIDVRKWFEQNKKK
jgi:hypothetical protein